MNDPSTWCEAAPDPFRSAASMSLPVQFRRILRWCEMAWLANRPYAESVRRTISYFFTEVDAANLPAEEATEWRQLTSRVLNFPTEGRLAVEESHIYGAGFVTLVVPFKRFLVCKGRGGRCGWLRSLRAAAETPNVDFDYACPEFVLTCPQCGYRGPFRVRDFPHDLENKLKLKRWSPHEIETVHNLETGDDRILWRIPRDYAATLKRPDCDLFHLERTNMKVLQAISRDALFEFHADTVYQIKQPTISGLPLRGWGIPDPLLHKDRIYLLQVIRRTCEALGLDYALPFRVITPAPRQGAGGGGDAVGFDPWYGNDPRQVQQFIQKMIWMRRYDPASIHTAPIPLQYQVFGADLNQIVPMELLEFEEQGLLRDSGAPVELWQGTLSLQATPVALRLMESSYSHVAYRINDMLRWVGKAAARLLDRRPPDLSMRKVTMADDVERQLIAMQLMQSGDLSKSDGLRLLGYEYAEQQKRIVDDALVAAKAQAEGQAKMQDAGLQQAVMRAGDPAQQAQQGGQPGGPQGAGGQGAPQGQGGPDAAGGAPGAGPSAYQQFMANSSAPQTLDDMLATASAIASELLGAPDGERAAKLKTLRETNEPMHRMVRGQMDHLRSRQNSQAGQQARSQQQQQPGQAVAA